MTTTNLDFEYVTVDRLPEFKELLEREGDESCEMSFVNLIIWQRVYDFKTALIDGCVLIRSVGEDGEMIYRLPICDDFERGMGILRTVSGTDRPNLWAVEGERLDRFLKAYGEGYNLIEDEDGGDYIYLRQDLAELSGKKFQAKRNHISAFSRAYSWRFEPLCDQNKDELLRCAERWYAENADRMDEFMAAEREGVHLLIENAERLNVSGGAIFIGDEAVAFTLGSPINGHTYNVHIEKALSDYSTAYSVINREFARYIPERYTLINREDDMGHEGLRRAKMSYRPIRLLKKFYCRPR